MAKNLIQMVIITIVYKTVISNFQDRNTVSGEISYSNFIQEVKQGAVREVTMQGPIITGVRSSGGRFRTYSPETDNKALIGTLLESGVTINAKEPEGRSLLLQILISWFPF